MITMISLEHLTTITMINYDLCDYYDLARGQHHYYD